MGTKNQRPMLENCRHISKLSNVAAGDCHRICRNKRWHFISTQANAFHEIHAIHSDGQKHPAAADLTHLGRERTSARISFPHKNTHTHTPIHCTECTHSHILCIYSAYRHCLAYSSTVCVYISTYLFTDENCWYHLYLCLERQLHKAYRIHMCVYTRKMYYCSTYNVRRDQTLAQGHFMRVMTNVNTIKKGWNNTFTCACTHTQHLCVCIWRQVVIDADENKRIGQSNRL